MKRKKILALLLAVIFTFSLAACSSKEETDKSVPTPAEQNIEVTPAATEAPTEAPVTAAEEEPTEAPTPAMSAEEAAQAEAEQIKAASVALNGGDFTPSIEGKYMYAGKVSAFLPTGWMNDPVLNFEWNEDDLESTDQIDPCALSFVKDAKESMDSWTHAAIKISYSENDYGIWDTRSYYQNIEELDFVAGNYHWQGFVGTDESGKYKTATLNPDGRGDINVSVTMRNSETGEELTFEDEDVLTILASVKVDDTPANFEYVDPWGSTGTDTTEGSTGYIDGADTPAVGDGAIRDPYPNLEAKEICGLYADYLINLANEQNCAETMRFTGAFIDNDDIPELLVQTDENSEIMLLKLENDEPVVVESFAFNGYSIFGTMGMNDYFVYGIDDDNDNQIMYICRYDGTGCTIEAEISIDKVTELVIVNGEETEEEEAYAFLESFYEDANTDYTGLYAYSEAGEYESEGAVADNIADEINWPDSYYSYGYYENEELLGQLEGSWVLNGGYYYNYGDPDADPDGELIDCAAELSIADGIASLTFSYEGEAFCIENASVMLYKPQDLAEDEYSWTGEICDEESNEQGTYIYIYADPDYPDFLEVLIVFYGNTEDFNAYGYDLGFARVEI